MRSSLRAQQYDPRGQGTLDVPGEASKLRTREVFITPVLTGAVVTMTGLIPATVWCWGVVVQILEDITGSLTTFDVGDGTDVDRWGAGILLVEGTRTNSNSFTAATSMGFFTTTAVDVVLDADGANTFSGGTIRVGVMLSDITSNTRRGAFS